MRLGRLAAGLALWGACCFASGQGQNGQNAGDRWLLSQWHRRVWQIEDGLPHNYVTATARDSERYLLVGTQTGIARFDGTRFTPFPGLGDLWVYSMLRTPDGSLWVGTYLHGLYRVRGDRAEAWKLSEWSGPATVYSMLQGSAQGPAARRHSAKELACCSSGALASGPVVREYPGSSGGMWLASAHGLEYMDQGRAKLVIAGGNTSGYGWQSIAQDNTGAVWFASSRGLFRYADGRSEAIQTAGIKGLPVTVYSWPERKQLYLGTTGGFYQLACSVNKCAGRLLDQVTGPVVNVRGISDGSLWVGTWGQGLYRITAGRTEKLSSRDGLADDFVRTISEDSEHNVWVGTRGGGLTRFRATILKPVGIPEGLNGNCASVAAGDGGDGVWLGTWRSGLYHWQNGVIRNQPLPQPSLGTLISALATNRRGDLWIGTFQNLWFLPRGKGPAKEVPIDRTDGPISHILVAASGSLWIAKDGEGLLVYQSGDPRTSSPHRLLPNENVTALLQAENDDIWIASTSGVWRATDLANPRLLPVDVSFGDVTALSQDSRGRIWIASATRQTYVYNAGTTKEIQLSNLPPSQIYGILEDGQGSIWFTTGRGLAEGRIADVDRVLTGGAGAVNLTSYGVAEGMRTIECRCAREPQSWRMPDGAIWVPTAKGFLQIDSSRKQTLAPPRPLIEEAVLDGKPLSVHNTIRISPGDHELEARFTAIRLGPAEGVRFRYRLEGFEDNWFESGSQRFAHYSHLPPGRFRLAVSARDAAGRWSDPVGIQIEQRAHLYQNLWFRLGLVALLASSVLLLFQFRLRMVRARYKSVLEERNRIAREWHDTLLAGMSAVAWQVDAAIQVCSESVVANNLRDARGMLRYCRDEARRAIGDLRDDPVNEPRLIEAMGNALHKLTLGTEVQAQLDVDEKLPRLPSGFGADLVRICQEATANAMRHGHASKIFVRLNRCGSRLSLSIEDNGIGVPAETLAAPPAGHFGILGMRERAEKLGGTFKFSSQMGQGTVVQAVVPLPK